MKIQQIRNATLQLSYGGVRFLIDPMLATKGAYPGFPGTHNEHLSNPLVDLPMPVEQILDVDAVIVTHLHPDHWDEVALSRIPKQLPLFTQDENDAEQIAAAGFSNVRVLTHETSFNGVSLTKTAGQHGTDAAYAAIGEILGNVCGVVFEHPEEKTLYLAGDTIWNSHVQNALSQHQPEVVIVNAGAALVPGLGLIIMGTEDVQAVHRAQPDALIVASHMEAVNHGTLSRAQLLDFARDAGFAEKLRVPEDGEIVSV